MQKSRLQRVELRFLFGMQNFQAISSADNTLEIWQLKILQHKTTHIVLKARQEAHLFLLQVFFGWQFPSFVVELKNSPRQTIQKVQSE